MSRYEALEDAYERRLVEIDQLETKLAWSLAVVRQMTDCLGTLCNERYEQRYEAKEPKVCCYDVIEQARALLAGEAPDE